jgi:hypothetical protein
MPDNSPATFSIIDNSTGKALLTGNRQMVLENITDSTERNKAITRLEAVQERAARAEAAIAQSRQALMADRVAHLGAQCDAIARRVEAEEQRRADRKRRDEQEMQARAAEYINRLPDPEQGELSAVADNPQPGSSELVTHPAVSHLGKPDDGPTGSLPRELDPPDLDQPEPEHLAQPPKSPQQSQPTSISLW